MAENKMWSRCGACKCLKRKCTEDCPLAPYFPADDPKKFSNVHEVFGANNVTKILNKLEPSQREAAANALAYEAEHHVRDPIHGCLRQISNLHHQLTHTHALLENAKKEWATYIGPSAYQPMPQNVQPMLVDQPQQQLVIPPPHQQQHLVFPEQALPQQQQFEVEQQRALQQQQRLMIQPPHQQQHLVIQEQALSNNNNNNNSLWWRNSGRYSSNSSLRWSNSGRYNTNSNSSLRWRNSNSWWLKSKKSLRLAAEAEAVGQ